MPSQFQLQKAFEMMTFSAAARILIVWLICLASLRLDYLNDFDLRFQIRGDRQPSADIVIIELNPSDLRHFNTSEVQDLVLLNSSNDISDHYYWNSELWNSLLSNLLQMTPKSIVITLDLVQQAKTQEFNPTLLTHPKISWVFGQQNEALSLPFIPLFERKRVLEVLNIEYEKDGLVRRINPGNSSSTAKFINFQGSENRFLKISYNTLIHNAWPINFFRDKIIVIGGFTNTDYEFLTPVGPFSRSSLIAQLIENKIYSQWIKSMTFWPQSFVFLILISFIYFSTVLLPKNLSVTIALITAVGLLVINVYFFDILFIWFPIVTATLCIFLGWLTGYTVLMGIIENKNFKLEQENVTRKQLELMKTNFISLISHDLKNPLAKIQSVVQRNLSSVIDHRWQSDLTSIQKYTEELDHYIRSILNIARVESQDVKLNLVPSDLNRLIELSLESLKPFARDKDINFKTQLTPLFLIEIDPILIKEALINIIENAIKYSPPRSLINIKTYESENLIIVEITDQGIGLSEADLKNVGQKFFRAESSSATVKGTGLGVFLVKYFVELHSGSIDIASTLNKGTTVLIKLPNR